MDLGISSFRMKKYLKLYENTHAPNYLLLLYL